MSPVLSQWSLLLLLQVFVVAVGRPVGSRAGERRVKDRYVSKGRSTGEW